MVSTPNAPEGLFERIEKELDASCLYHRLFLDYTHGLGKIYTGEEVCKAMVNPSFEREYNLKYLGRVVNTFLSTDKVITDFLMILSNGFLEQENQWE
jgi:hypothetical protein